MIPKNPAFFLMLVFMCSCLITDRFVVSARSTETGEDSSEEYVELSTTVASIDMENLNSTDKERIDSFSDSEKSNFTTDISSDSEKAESSVDSEISSYSSGDSSEITHLSGVPESANSSSDSEKTDYSVDSEITDSVIDSENTTSSADSEETESSGDNHASSASTQSESLSSIDDGNSFARSNDVNLTENAEPESAEELQILNELASDSSSSNYKEINSTEITTVEGEEDEKKEIQSDEFVRPKKSATLSEAASYDATQNVPRKHGVQCLEFPVTQMLNIQHKIYLIPPMYGGPCNWRFKTEEVGALLTFRCEYLSLLGPPHGTDDECHTQEEILVSNTKDLQKRFCGEHQNLRYATSNGEMLITLSVPSYPEAPESFHLDDCTVSAQSFDPNALETAT